MALGPQPLAPGLWPLAPGPSPPAYPVTVNVFPDSDALYFCSDRDAGPRTTSPLVLKSDPWQGHSKFGAAHPVMVQAWCVQPALKAVNVSAAVCATSTAAPPALTSAAEPTATESTATVTVFAFRVPVRIGRFDAPLGPLGLPPPLPPPHAGKAAPTASSVSV